MSKTPWLSRWKARWRQIKMWVGGFLYGMLFYETEIYFRRQRADLEHLFALILFGDMFGVPVLPPVYSLRLLPYVVPTINLWKRRLYRERDLLDLVADLEG